VRDPDLIPDLDPDSYELAPGDAVSCGLRSDLPKKQRVHVRLHAGPDVRHNPGTGAFEEVRIFICARCGRDIVKGL